MLYAPPPPFRSEQGLLLGPRWVERHRDLVEHPKPCPPSPFRSEQGLLLGPRWVERHRDLVERYGQQYHELTWQPLIRPLERVLNEVRRRRGRGGGAVRLAVP